MSAPTSLPSAVSAALISSHSAVVVVSHQVEYRRAIDYLATRPDIDAARIGALGYDTSRLRMVPQSGAR